MASNYFGKIFRFTSWGESHGPAIGVVIDGYPAGIKVDIDYIQQFLDKRKPGVQKNTSARKECDKIIILSGIKNNITLGSPISVVVYNNDVDSSSYNESNNCYRPGHADYTYYEKYKVHSPSGGGRASARETVARVIAGGFAQILLNKFNIKIHAYVESIEKITKKINITDWPNYTYQHNQWHPDKNAQLEMEKILDKASQNGDTLGGSVGFVIQNCPKGIGEPIYDKLSARLAYALMSIPATKGFSYGSGFMGSTMHGSKHNDYMSSDATFKSNNAGGILGGISSGEPITGALYFKPISSIKLPQETINHKGVNVTYQRSPNARHDPTAVIRAVPVVSAMIQCVLCDLIIMADNNAVYSN